MLLHVLNFQSNDDSVIHQGRIIHTVTVRACTYSGDHNETVLSFFLFFTVKRESNVLPKFFKMFSIVQFMMFIKEIISIQLEFSMIRSRVERRDRVAQFLCQKQI